MKISNEASFLLELIRSYIFSSKPAFPLSNTAIEYCSQFGLGPILALTYLKYNDLVTEELKKKLLSIEMTAKFFATSHNRAITEILNEAQNQGIKVILLKGIHLSNQYYEYPYLRLMGDIDILVQQSDIHSISMILKTLGYIQKSDNPDTFYETHHHLKPFYNQSTNIWVEVHIDVFPQTIPFATRSLFQINYISQNLIPGTLNNYNYYALSPELNLHYTITHWIREFKISTSLIQIIDILRIIKMEQIDWNKFVSMIETRSHATEVKLTLGFLIESRLITIHEDTINAIYSKKDTMGFLGNLILKYLFYGYIYDNKFITQILGDANCAGFFRSYLREKSSISNHFNALVTFIFPSDTDSPSTQTSFRERFLSLLRRSRKSTK
jgi:hypothetical protein